MWVPRGRRREIKASARAWAAELVDVYGSEADRVMLSCLEHPGYSAGERYCFRRVRTELRRMGVPSGRPPFRFVEVARRLLFGSPPPATAQ